MSGGLVAVLKAWLVCPAAPTAELSSASTCGGDLGCELLVYTLGREFAGLAGLA